LWAKVGRSGKGNRVFIGEYEHSLDGKNRLNIPSSFRETIEADEATKVLYITLGLDTCLFLYTESQWGKVAASLRAMQFTGADARRFNRIFFSSARKAEIDDQGRILVPESLKTQAQITKGVTVVGVDERIEIWDRELWKIMKTPPSGEFERLAEELYRRKEGV
jgi:MraZ protein